MKERGQLTNLISYAPGSRKGRVVHPGSTIGIVAPAGPIDPGDLAPALARLHRWGYRTVVGKAVLSKRGYLAGTDTERAADFHYVWSNPQVDAVLCARGGYGVIRILPLLDWDLFRREPKFFCGFSDITALHVALERRCGLITFHGPMAIAFGNAERYNMVGLQTALSETRALGPVPWPEPALEPVRDAPRTDFAVPRPVTLVSGVADGRLAGGNLSLLCSLMGTPWEPDFAGRILILEDVDEPPYRIDRMLQQLLLAGKLQQASAIVFGDSPSCEARPGADSLTLGEVLQDHLGPLGVPVLYGFPCGHTDYRATIPLGVMARLDAGAAQLTCLESALLL